MESMLDIAVIGAGAAGLSAAVNALARGKSVRVFSNKGTYLARAERVDNYLGFFHIDGQTLMDSFHRHAEAMGIKAEAGKVVNVLPFENCFMINFNGDVIQTKTVILAVGAAKMKLIAGEERLVGSGVSYCATCDGMLYRGKRAIVCGQADDIVEEANFLQRIGVNVIFIAKHMRPAGLSDEIAFVPGAVGEIVGTSSAEGVRVNGQTIAADVVFILRNALAPAALVDKLALENGSIAVNKRMETNIAGIYACGDCTGAPLQVAKAVGEGLVAALQAAKYIDEPKEA